MPARVGRVKNANPRRVALDVVRQVLERGRALDDIYRSDWYRGLRAPARDLAFARELAYGLCRWYTPLAGVLRERLEKPLRARDRDVEILLLLGLYQLLVAGTGAHAAVNETVAVAGQLGKGWARGLVNAVLRGVARDGIALDPAAAAWPDWLERRLRADWGERAEAVLRAGLTRAPMVLRVDTARSSVEACLERLAEAGIGAGGHPLVASAIVLQQPRAVDELPGFDDGILSVQDAAAQLAAPLLDCPPGSRVLDACAAPGGKSLHLLQRYPGIELDLLDQSRERLALARQNLERGGREARLLVGDASRPGPWCDRGGYQRILADVPCSASGVVRRHPDIPLLRGEKDIMPLLARQRAILDTLWRLLELGGKMLYATCSVFKDENEAQIGAFVDRHADCAEIPLNAADWGLARTHGRQILTGSFGMDGFYYALLGKREAGGA